ncbi:MAG: polyprenol phosphomannose-dependent alpha 1,6 mannosyltransferase MptB [Motilibacteraceae bacterium]
MTEPVPAATGRSGSGRQGRWAVALVLAALLLGWTTSLLGGSVAVPPLAGGSPPFDVGARPGAWLVVGLLVAAYSCAGAGVLVGLHALRRGWTPDARRLVLLGAVAAGALCMVPPSGSADHLSYAAYGRIVVQGGDPYSVVPSQWRGDADPVVSAIQPPWRSTPSVYGPVATAEQALASLLGGDSPARTVWWLQVLNAVAVVTAGALLVRAAGRDPGRRSRAAFLLAANPLVLLPVVGGAHVDGLAVALAVGGMVVLDRRPLVAGLLLGAGAATKADVALLCLAAAWALHRDLPALVRLAAGGLLAVVPGYVLAGGAAVAQLSRASQLVSFATPWHLVAGLLDDLLGRDVSRRLVNLLALALAVAVGVALHRLLPRRSSPEVSDGPSEKLAAAARAGVVLTGAWLLSTPYALPWYDVVLWAPLALVPGSALVGSGLIDTVAALRTATLALAYVPGRVVLPRLVEDVTLAWRGGVTPWIELVLLLLVLRQGLRRDAPAAGEPPVPSTPRPAAAPPPAGRSRARRSRSR